MSSIEVSNADRVVFPGAGITKGDVFAYYQKAGDALLPYVGDRALTVERYPKGIGEEGFMQKNAPRHYPDHIGRHRAPKEGGGTTVYPVIDSVDGIAFFANLGVITFHVPPVRVDDPDHPDWVIWDLDPPNGEVGRVRQAAHVMRQMLREHGVEVVPMTSGSKGYHLRARVRKGPTSEGVAAMARGVAVLGAEQYPDLLTVEFLKKKRADRVFVDWLRNAPYSTAVAPWSLRARDDAPVAAPLGWDEVDDVEPAGIHLGDVAPRIEDDPWVDLAPIDLEPAISSVRAELEDAGIDLPPFDRFRS